jgi:glycosyltransferase involved in cell wall biosynthesis
MMKLLFYDSEIPEFLKNIGNPFGGACVRQYAIARGLVANGCQVGILTWKGAKDYVADKDYPFELVESYQRGKGIRVLRAIYLWVPKFYQATRGYSPDYLFQKGPAALTLMLGLVSKLSGCRFVFMATSNKDVDDRLATVMKGSIRFLYKAGLNLAHVIICQNNFQWQLFTKKYPDKRIILMRNPYFSEEELKPPKPLGERKYFAWIGNYRSVKNLPAVYEIAKNLPHYQFKVAGTVTMPKSYGSETRDAVEKLSSCKNVELVGHLKREEVVPFLSEAYALFNTSFVEGFSNTFLESLAAGTPIVTRNEIDPDGMIANNKLGIIVKDYEEMPQALEKVATLDSFQEMAERCQKYLSDHHDPYKITGKLLQELENHRGE